MRSRALAAAPACTSNRRTAWPACATTWAMPAPMLPAPMTATAAPLQSNTAATSAILELRGPARDERSDAFAVIVRAAKFALRVSLGAQGLLVGQLRGVVHHPPSLG